MFTFDEVYQTAQAVAEGGTCYSKAAERAWVLPDSYGDLECVYFGPFGEPACLVGQVLDRLDLRELAEEQTAVPSTPLASAPWLEQMDNRAVAFLREAQRIQDANEHRPWVDCIAGALEEMGEKEMA